MKYLKKFNTSTERDSFLASNQNIFYPYIHYVSEDNDVKFSGEEVEVPFYIESSTGSKVYFSSVPYEYSYDGLTWTTVESNVGVTIGKNEKCYFRAYTIDSTTRGIGSFSSSTNASTTKWKLGGNIMSMLYGEDFKDKTKIEREECFYQMFYGRNETIDASRLALPATEISRLCYASMFAGCTNMTKTPSILPATKLEVQCYFHMFSGCTRIKKGPKLPATKLAKLCYDHMFKECTALTETPDLPATTLADSCYSYMFQYCRNLTKASNLPAKVLEPSCYSGMFHSCGLVSAPVISATILNSSSCQYMFDSCSSLIKAPSLPATTLANNCYSYMFRGCTSLVTAPVLPAKQGELNCYSNMFNGCTNLNYIKMMLEDTPLSDYCASWVTNVASEGTFVKSSNAEWTNSFGASAIPTGWTVELANS